MTANQARLSAGAIRAVERRLAPPCCDRWVRWLLRRLRDSPAKHLARALAEGFAYQGEVSPFTREPRGEPSADLPPACFVDFMQNHDQVGNRAFGERLVSLARDRDLKALAAIHLLAPSPPLIFMGEEWGAGSRSHLF
jgi:1,4-alpha-glucan branching enzyme